MPRGFMNARHGGTNVPMVRTVAYATGQTFKRGALLIDNAAGTYQECIGDAPAIAGVALQGAGTGPGYDVSGTPTVVTGRVQEVSMLDAAPLTEFSGRAVNGAVDPVLPLQTHIGELYPVKKVADDWVIDMTPVVSPAVPANRIEITDIDADAKMFLFKFLSSVISGQGGPSTA